MPPQFIYVMKDLRKVVPPSREILRGIWLSFYPGAKIGVLGANGAGKSSLLRIMAGVDHDFQGEAWPHEGTRIGYLAQEPQLDPTKNVKDNVEVAVKPVKDLLKKFEEISNKFAEPMSDDAMTKLLDQQAKVQEKIDALNAWDIDRKVEIAMDALRLPPGDADVGKLSGGERRRVALCRTLLEEPDMLLLDEPTNHLDAESVAWLERFLAEFPGTVVAVTHDRYFLDNVAGWILELDRGAGIPYEGNYSSWLEQKRTRLAQEEKTASARQKTLERELEWVRLSPRARQSKSKARIQKYEELASEQQQEKVTQNEIVIPPAPRLGNDVVIAKDLEQKRTRLAQEEKTASARQKTLERELEWVRLSPRARQSKSKARIQKYEELASEQQQEKVTQNEIVIPPAPRLGNDVVIAKDLEQKRTRLAQEEKTASARQKTLERELEWVRLSPRARQSKSKARIQKYEELASEQQQEKVTQNEIVIPPAPRLGNDVVIAKDLEQKRTRLAQEEKTASARQKTLERELEWVRLSPRARQSKSKARIQKYEELASEQQQEKVTQNEIVIPPAPRLGNDVVIAKDLEQKRTRLAQEEKTASARQKTLERELEWVRLSPRARQSKSKARIQKYEELASEQQQEKVTQNEIVIPPAPRLGNDVVIAKDLEQKRTRLAQEEKTASARQKTLERELEWVRLSPRARQSKSKARIQKYEELASEQQQEKVTQNEIVIPPAPRLGNDVVIAKDLEQKRTRLAQEEKTASARQKTLERELEWVRLSPRARQSKSKARIQKYEELASEQQQEKVTQNEIVIPPAPRLGNDVVIAKDLK